MEVHKTTHKNNAIWTTKVDNEDKAIALIAQDSGFSTADVGYDIVTHGYFDGVTAKYNITHDRKPE